MLFAYLLLFARIYAQEQHKLPPGEWPAEILIGKDTVSNMDTSEYTCEGDLEEGDGFHVGQAFDQNTLIEPPKRATAVPYNQSSNFDVTVDGFHVGQAFD